MWLFTSSGLSASFVVDGVLDTTKLGVEGAGSTGEVSSANRKPKRHICNVCRQIKILFYARFVLVHLKKEQLDALGLLLPKTVQYKTVTVQTVNNC